MAFANAQFDREAVIGPAVLDQLYCQLSQVSTEFQTCTVQDFGVFSDKTSL